MLPTQLLKSLFSCGLIRRGFNPSAAKSCPSKLDPLPLPHWVLHDKLSIKLTPSTNFKRGYILADGDTLSFGEGLHKTSISKRHPLDKQTLTSLFNTGNILKGHNHRLTDDTPQSTTPRLRPVDTILQSTPSKITLTDHDLRQGFGFRNTNSICNKLHSFTTNTFSLTTSDSPDIIDLGEVATIDKSKRNTTPLTLPLSFGEVVHCDILYGSNIAIKGFRYALFLIDKATCFKFVYGLKTLNDVLPIFKRFCADIGTVPKELCTDFDKKLMGAPMQSFMNDKGSIISSVPAGKQRSNGICERSWRSLLRMSRSWLLSNLMPTKFWYHALKRAAEVSNYLPIKINNHLTTPFELVYNKKPDLRNLFPLFSVGYIRRSRDSTTNRLTFHSTSLRCICIGRDDTSNQLEFFHPPSRQLVYSDDFVLDKHLCSGPTFNLDYDGGLYINKYKDYQDDENISPFPPDHSMFVQTSSNPQTFKPCTILRIPEQYGDTYTVRYDNGDIHQHGHWDLYDYNPSSTDLTNLNTDKTIPSWITHNCNATIFLPNMDQPRHGQLLHANDKWLFKSGKGQSTKYIELLDFQSVARDMIK